MAQVTIDGKAIEFSAGESLIEAATRSSIEIPYYCWHPRLSVAANCRMCLVELEKAPKLVPACQTECKEGMVVHTTNAKVKDAQRAVHEFLLINHPIDCPICDQAGECKLQDYYMKFQLTPSRMRDAKVHKPKLEQLGPYVVYNAERCIVCTRCVRFMEEVAGERQLGVFNRGDHSVIGTFPGQELNNPYSLNTVDVCPVGALTSTAFRFKQRVWNLQRSPSVCSGCARGCNIHVDQRSAQVYRLLPRENDAVNKSWLCDEGRLTYNRANEGRLDHALSREGAAGGAVPAMAAQALAKALTLLEPAAKTRQLAVALSLQATCEEAYVLGRLAKDVFGATQVSLLGYAPGTADDLLRVADKNPNRAGITRVLTELGLTVDDEAALVTKLAGGKVRALLCVGHETHLDAKIAAAAAGLEIFVHIAHARSPLSDVAHVTLPGASWVQTEGSWINVDGRVQRLTPAFPPQGEGRANHLWLMEIGTKLGGNLTFPSVKTIQAEMEKRLPSFAQIRLTALGATGQPLAQASA